MPGTCPATLPGVSRIDRRLVLDRAARLHPALHARPPMLVLVQYPQDTGATTAGGPGGFPFVRGRKASFAKLTPRVHTHRHRSARPAGTSGFDTDGVVVRDQRERINRRSRARRGSRSCQSASHRCAPLLWRDRCVRFGRVKTHSDLYCL